jgi:chromosome segregation ATPase
MDNNDERYLELLAEMVMKQDAMVDELKLLNKKADTTNERIDTTNDRLDTTNDRLEVVIERLDSLEKHQAKANLGISEIRLSVMKLGERDKIVSDHEKRIRKIESKMLRS